MATTSRPIRDARVRDPLLSPLVLAGRSKTLPGRSIVWMDVLRVVAIVCVVTIHTVSTVTTGARVPLLSASWWVGATINAASLWCVPVFVMISGALLLHPSHPQPVSAFYRRRLERIGVPLVVWTAFYLVFRTTFLGDDLTLGKAAHDVASGQPFMQIYFLYVIAGLYVVTPPLRRLLRHCDERQWLLVAIGALAYAVLDATLHDLAHAGGTNAITRCLAWVGYYVAGGLLRRMTLPRRAVPTAVAAFVVSVGLTVGVSGALAAHYGWKLPAYYLFSYQSPTVVVMSLAVFVLGRALGERSSLQPRRWFSAVARATFGVFLIHPILLLPYLRVVGLPGSAQGIAVTVPAVSLVVVLVTTAVALLMERVPLVRRLV